MLLPSTSPELGVNLSKLRDRFDDAQYAALEGVFRTMFRNLENMQKTSGYVINWNALETFATADLPAEGGDMNDTAVIEDTGSGLQLRVYANDTSFVLEPAVAPSVQEAFPVGAIYTSVSDTDPATTLGYGTWEAFGAGKVLVGLDSGDTDFDTAEETGGEKTHTLTVAEMPTHTHTQNSHNHTQNAHSHDAGASFAAQSSITGTAVRTTATGTINTSSVTPTNNAATATNQNTGGGGAHNNLQPYIVVYFWKRTA